MSPPLGCDTEFLMSVSCDERGPAMTQVSDALAVSDALTLLRKAALVSSGLDTALRDHGLTTDRWRALMLIAEQPGASMADVIDALVIAPTSATRAIDSLVESGAIFRSPAADDRRRVTLQLSVHGADLLREVESVVVAIHREVSAELPGPR